MDSKTQTPISKVTVLSTPWGGKPVAAVSDDQGSFRFHSQRRLHWMPLDRGVSTTLEFSHPAYHPLVLKVGMGNISDRFSDQTPPENVLGEVIMIVKQFGPEPDGTAKGSQSIRSETNTPSAGFRR